MFNGVGFGIVIDFFGIDDPNFRGGARAAIGDVNGDGFGDLVVSAGFQGGPRVAGYSVAALATGTKATVFPDFYAFEQAIRNGTYVTVGDIDGDGRAEVIAGGGPGGGPRVTAFSGGGLVGGQFTPVANYFGGDSSSRGGIRVGVKNLDGDDRADIVVGAGDGGREQGNGLPREGDPDRRHSADGVRLRRLLRIRRRGVRRTGGVRA